jgi:carbon storage regulator
MLVLSRKMDEVIVIGQDIHIKIVEIRGSRVKLGISAPDDVAVRRAEICIELPFEGRSCEEAVPAGVCGFGGGL